MAYGTVGRFRIKAGHMDDAIAILKEWERDRKPTINGAVGGYTLQPDLDQDSLFVMAVFADQKAYLANADDPEQDTWFRRLAEHFAAEPEWHDGQVVTGL